MALGIARKGRFKFGFAFAGQNADRVDWIVSVNELMSTLIQEYHLAVFSREKTAAYA